MSKRSAVYIISVVAVAGAILGLYLYNNTNDNIGSVTSATSQTEQVKDSYISAATTYDESMDFEYTDDTVNTDTQSDTGSLQSVVSTDLKSDNTTEIVDSTFNIERIIDHTTGEQVQPRVVFGSSYRAESYYVRFNSDSSFELCVDAYSDNSSKHGTYTEYDDIISVVYEDKTASEYNIIRSDSGVISSIIVNYGDYDLYFA